VKELEGLLEHPVNPLVMDKHEEFTRWAELQGVKIYGIAAHQFPGRGLGLVATERHEVCQAFHIVHPRGLGKSWHNITNDIQSILTRNRLINYC
jgi:hypothetical protein